MSEEFTANRIKEARVFIHRDSRDDVILRITSSDSDERNYLISRTEFIRLASSLAKDAARLSADESKGQSN